jgi:hypothetical protein
VPTASVNREIIIIGYDLLYAYDLLLSAIWSCSIMTTVATGSDDIIVAQIGREREKELRLITI